MKTRDEITRLLPDQWAGCELGVFLCEFSAALAKDGRMRKLYLVDTFDGLVTSGDKDGNNMRTLHGDHLHAGAKLFAAADERIEVIRSDSRLFLASLPNESLDFAYIDTSHDRITTLEELRLCREKVKRGGMIAGHDYHKHRFPGVCEAVDEFCTERGLSFCLTTDDGLPSFMIHNR